MFLSAENSRIIYVVQQLLEILRYVQSIVSHKSAHLVMLRVGIGLGWLMSGFSKLSDPVWHNGDTLTAFLNTQLATNAVYVPLYEALITDLFLPNIVELSWVVMMGEWIVGLALLSGTLTYPALFFGVIMNINMILAGVLSPAIIYAVIQIILYRSDAGKYFSIDAFLSRYKQTVMYIIVPSEERKRLTNSGDNEPNRLDSTPPLEPNVHQAVEDSSHESTHTAPSRNRRPFFHRSKDVFMGGSMADSDLFNR